MEIRKISVDALSLPEVLALLDIARGISPRRPDWKDLKQKLRQFELCGIYDRTMLVGYAQIEGRCPYFGGSVQIVSLRYLWPYHQEKQIAGLLRGIAELYCHESAWLVMDVDSKQDLNYSLYIALGFQVCPMCSPSGQDHVLLLCPVESLLKD